MNHLWRTQSAYLGARRRQLVHLEIHLLPALEVVGRHAGQIEPCAAEQKIISRVRKGALGGLSRAGCGSLLASPATGRGRTRSGGCYGLLRGRGFRPDAEERKRGVGGFRLHEMLIRRTGLRRTIYGSQQGRRKKGPHSRPATRWFTQSTHEELEHIGINLLLGDEFI
jgi:hypothetical protein